PASSPGSCPSGDRYTHPRGTGPRDPSSARTARHSPSAPSRSGKCRWDRRRPPAPLRYYRPRPSRRPRPASASKETSRMRLPLEDVTVLDLSHALAGPFCSTMLADFGARVIKLEPKGAGDIARAWGTPLPGGETAYFVSLHRNKQGIEVDLKARDGKELFFKLIEKADVVLENYRTGALERLGLAYAEGRKRNPGIIYCSVSGFGQDGPYRDRAALDL